MPSATELHFVEGAEMMDTKVGQATKDDPAMVAEVGFEVIAHIAPADLLAEAHRKMAEPTH